MQWQPIDTAPKDGTLILVYPGLWTGKTCSIARFNGDEYSNKPRPYWSRDDAYGRINVSRDKPPTHWMPLPPAIEA